MKLEITNPAPSDNISAGARLSGINDYLTIKI